MTLQERRELITALERIRNSRVLCYVLSDRDVFPGAPGFQLQINNEPQYLFWDHLIAIGKVPQLDLLLYTRGGSTDAVWPFVNMLKKYCERLTVLVPFRAHSAGTLICLGADEIVMTDMAELSPIDPTTGNLFNPPDPTNPNSRLGISVEDVAAYFELCTKRADITEPNGKIEVLKELTKTVHPLALGNVQRVYMQIRNLANKLLGLHLVGDQEQEPFNQMIQALTERFYSHVHAISRDEAKALLGSWVRAPSEPEAEAIRNLFNSYVETLNLRTKFQIPEYMENNQVRELIAIGGFIESTELSHVHLTQMDVIQRANVPTNIQVQVPPGVPIPIVPGFSRSFEYNIKSIGWNLNGEEV